MAGANPFLSDADFTDYGSGDADVAVSHMGVNSNPFLSSSDFSISEGGGENPFLSDAGSENQDTNSFVMNGAECGTGTNPFASDFIGGDVTEVDFFGGGSAPSEDSSTPATTIPASTTSSAFQNIFADVASQDHSISEIDLMAPTFSAPPSVLQSMAAPERPAPPPRPPPAAHFPPAKPPPPAQHHIFGTEEHVAPPIHEHHEEPQMVDLLGDDEADEETSAETSQIMSQQKDLEHTIHQTPSRPPPPRPAPPSRETQELILSVTGAMEATSSHLLDRLRATKTPSPTPIRELHSPSPSPDPAASFLMTDEPPSVDLLGEVSMDTQEGTIVRSSSPILQQTPTSVPIPSNDFLDIFGGDSDKVTNDKLTGASTEPLKSVPPPKPPPPHPPPPTSNADLLGLFGSQPVVSSTAIPTDTAVDVLGSVAILSAAAEPLYSSGLTSATPPTTSSADLLMGDFTEPEITIAPTLPSPTAQLKDNSEEAKFLADSEEESSITQQVVPTADGGCVIDSKIDSDFEAFAAKFESAAKEEDEEGKAIGVGGGDPFDPFASKGEGFSTTDAWGATGKADGNNSGAAGFGGEDDQFDAFLSMGEPLAPTPTPAKFNRKESADSDDGGPDFSIFIKPKVQETGNDGVDLDAIGGALPALAPPPKSPLNAAYSEQTVGGSRFNPFDKGGIAADDAITTGIAPASLALDDNQTQGDGETGLVRSDSQETPPTPLFDEDVSQPLEDFPRTIHDEEEGWEMQLRQPNKKKITGQRFWKKVYVKLVIQGDNPVLQLYNTKTDKDPFQELPLQPCYSVSDISAQQYDAYGKIFTVKLQYVFYKERPGVRPGQVTKAERITNKLSQFAAYAIQGDYQGVKEFGSDLKKLGLPVEHAPQITQLLKLGSQSYEDLKIFSVVIEEALFRLSAHRDRALNYKSDEVQITAVDELYVEQNNEGSVTRQIARVRVFFLGFITGMPDIELGVNDMVRQGKEVVGRHDIIPVVTEEWIRLENVEFHSCVETTEYETTRVIKFKPPDACYIELMRFRVRPPKNRELPLQLKVTTTTTGNKIEIKGDILVPGFASRKLGQVPCEDISVRFPIPECWIYLFRVEKHFRYGSVKSAHRRTGKIKGIERLLGTVETMDQSLIEVTSGQAKYEHQHRAIVWRMSRLPKEGQGAYTTHQFVCRLALTSYDQMPEKLDPYVYVEFTMPATQVSHTTIRSVSVSGGDNDPPEKYVRYLARHEYRVEVEHTQGTGPGAYVSATITAPKAPETVVEEKTDDGSGKDSDSDSSS